MLAVAVLISFASDERDSFESEIAHAERSTRNAAGLLAHYEGRIFDGIEGNLQAVGRLRDGLAVDTDRRPVSVQVDLEMLRRGLFALNELGWFDRNGLEGASSVSPLARPESFADREFFKALRNGAAGGIVVSAPTRSAATGRWSFRVSSRIETEDGRFDGVASGTVDPREFAKVFSTLDFGRGFSATLFRRDGIVLAHAPGGLDAIRETAGDAVRFLRQPPGVSGTNRRGGITDGSPAIASFAGLRGAGAGLFVEVAISREAALAGFHDTLVGEAIQACITLVVILLGLRLLLVGLRRRERLQANLEAAADALRESEARYRSVVELLPDPILILTQSRIMFANAASLKAFAADRSDLVGREAISLVHPDDRAVVLERRTLSDEASRAHPLVEARHLRLDGSVFHGEATGAPIVWDGEAAYMVTIRDISDRFQAAEDKAALEARLRQAQKMESLGTLAGGTAHEFNNMLVPIKMLTELARLEIDEGSAAQAYLGKVVESADRAATLVRKILDFSRADHPERSRVDLRAVVEEVMDLLSATLPATIAIRMELDTAELPVLADNSQIHQAIVNLVSNAKHAMDGRTGTLSVRLGIVDCGEGLDTRTGWLEPGRYVALAVADTGCGMDEPTLARVFEPFFTTKEVGSGTGLGLPTVYGFVTGHGGRVDVASAPGRGTIFTVYLPLLSEETEEGQTAPVLAVAC